MTSFYDFLSLKNHVNVPSKSNKRLEGHWRKEQDPDPLVRVTDPRIRMRPKKFHESGTLLIVCPKETASNAQ